jgi:hydrogenase expression/formation protein HypC
MVSIPGRDMCLAVPVKILSIREDITGKMGKVQIDGLIKEISLDLVPTATVDDYVIAHVGYALNLLDKTEAEATIKLYEELNADH